MLISIGSLLVPHSYSGVNKLILVGVDGVVYQSVPNPADPTYQAFNSDAYHSGNILPNSGFLNVTVSGDQVKVDYISSYLPEDEKDGHNNGQVAYSYTIRN